MPKTTVELSEQAWNEIALALRNAGLAHEFVEQDDKLILDVSGDVCFYKKKPEQEKQS